LEGTDGKLRLVLSSKKVLSRIEEFESGSVCSNSLLAWNGQLLVTRRRAKVYEYVFDGRQTRALSEARELAIRSGLVLEVTDLSRQNVLRRILRLGLSRFNGGARARLASPSGSRTTPAEPQDGRAAISPRASRP
jgi:hypothetical protein